MVVPGSYHSSISILPVSMLTTAISWTRCGPESSRTCSSWGLVLTIRWVRTWELSTAVTRARLRMPDDASGTPAMSTKKSSTQSAPITREKSSSRRKLGMAGLVNKAAAAVTRDGRREQWEWVWGVAATAQLTTG